MRYASYENINRLRCASLERILTLIKRTDTYMLAQMLARNGSCIDLDFVRKTIIHGRFSFDEWKSVSTRIRETKRFVYDIRLKFKVPDSTSVILSSSTNASSARSPGYSNFFKDAVPRDE